MAGPVVPSPTEPLVPALTVWKFSTAAGAAHAARKLEAASTQGVVAVDNAAVVSWSRGTRAPQVEHLVLDPSGAALNEEFWGLLLGLIFFMPLIGAALGATTGTITGSLADVGIDDTFINTVRDRITPGSSALFALSTDGDLDQIRTALGTPKAADVLFTHLTADQLDALRTVFGKD